MKVCYCGVPGSYAEEAALAFFGSEASLLTASSFGGAFEKLKDGEAQRAVLPLENSSTGAVSAVYDLLGQYGFPIVGEQYIRINHCLLGRRGTKLSDIREVLSHEQGLSQSAEFLETHPQWVCKPVYNTAAAAKMVSQQEDFHMAAIASKRAAECYDLEILVPRTNFKEQNFTRFIIASKEEEVYAKSNKISIVFTLPHVVGSLCGVLQIFERSGMNLVKIESRPIAERNWEYRFFLDFLTDRPRAELEKVLQQVREKTQTMGMLGFYPRRPDEGNED